MSAPRLTPEKFEEIVARWSGLTTGGDVVVLSAEIRALWEERALGIERCAGVAENYGVEPLVSCCADTAEGIAHGIRAVRS